MSINGIYQFGTLTTKSGKVINFDDIDRDKDGKISQQEYNFIQKELCMDTVELTDEAQKNDDKNVTDYEFVLWNQEAHMQESFDTLCVQISTDFIGANAKYSSAILKELRAFLNDFKESYIKDGESIIDMADKFDEALLKKYNDIKQELLSKDN